MVNPVPSGEAGYAARDAVDDSLRPHDTITRRFLALGAGEAVARVIAFAATLVLARRLGAEGLGVVSFALAVLLYLSRIVDAGFDAGLGIREAVAHRDSLREFVPAVLAFRLVLAVVVMGAAAAFALALLPSPENLVVVLYTLTLIPLALSARWVLTGLDRAGSSGIARGTGELVAFLLVLVAVHEARDLWRVPLFQLAGDLVATVIVAFGARRLGLPLSLRWRADVIRPVIPHVTPYVASLLLGIVAFNAGILLLRVFRDAPTVGLYSAAYALVGFLLNIGGMYSLSLLPSLTELRGDHAARQDVYVHALVRVWMVVLPIAVGGAMIATGIMRTVFDAAFEPAGPVLAIFMISVPASILRSVMTSAIISERREDYLLRTVAATAVANAALNVLVIPIWGMTGAAVVAVTTECLRLVVSLRYSTRLGFATPRLVLGWKPVVAALVMALALLTPIARSLWVAIPVGAAVYIAMLVALGALRLRRGRLPEFDA